MIQRKSAPTACPDIHPRDVYGEPDVVLEFRPLAEDTAARAKRDAPFLRWLDRAAPLPDPSDKSPGAQRRPAWRSGAGRCRAQRLASQGGDPTGQSAQLVAAHDHRIGPVGVVE